MDERQLGQQTLELAPDTSGALRCCRVVLAYDEEMGKSFPKDDVLEALYKEMVLTAREALQ